MSSLGKYLRKTSQGLAFWCTGCGYAHHIGVDGIGLPSGPKWTWNKDVEKPTFSPSVLVRGIRPDMDEATLALYQSRTPNFENDLNDPRFRSVCHTFVIDGVIDYLGDCTHALAGQKVPLSEFPIAYHAGED